MIKKACAKSKFVCKIAVCVQCVCRCVQCVCKKFGMCAFYNYLDNSAL